MDPTAWRRPARAQSRLGVAKASSNPKIQCREGGFGSDSAALSRIIQELNQRFGTDFADDDRLVIQQVENWMLQDERLEQTIRVNTPENAMLTFRQVVKDHFTEMIDTHFKFYKQVDGNPEFAETLTKFLFDRYRSSLGLAGAASG